MSIGKGPFALCFLELYKKRLKIECITFKKAVKSLIFLSLTKDPWRFNHSNRCFNHVLMCACILVHLQLCAQPLLFPRDKVLLPYCSLYELFLLCFSNHYSFSPFPLYTLELSPLPWLIEWEPSKLSPLPVIITLHLPPLVFSTGPLESLLEWYQVWSFLGVCLFTETIL